MNWSPARVCALFFRTFLFVLQCIFFPLAPSPVAEGARGRRCFHFSCSPGKSHSRRPTLLSVLVPKTAHKTSCRGEFLFCQSPSGKPTALFRSGYSRNQASHGIHPRTRGHWVIAVGACVLVETSSSLNSSPVCSIARMIVRSLRAVATTATFRRWFCPPTIRS